MKQNIMFLFFSFVMLMNEKATSEGWGWYVESNPAIVRANLATELDDPNFLFGGLDYQQKFKVSVLTAVNTVSSPYWKGLQKNRMWVDKFEAHDYDGVDGLRYGYSLKVFATPSKKWRNVAYISDAMIFAGTFYMTSRPSTDTKQYVWAGFISSLATYVLDRHVVAPLTIKLSKKTVLLECNIPSAYFMKLLRF